MGDFSPHHPQKPRNVNLRCLATKWAKDMRTNRWPMPQQAKKSTDDKSSNGLCGLEDVAVDVAVDVIADDDDDDSTLSE